MRYRLAPHTVTSIVSALRSISRDDAAVMRDAMLTIGIPAEALDAIVAKQVARPSRYFAQVFRAAIEKVDAKTLRAALEWLDDRRDPWPDPITRKRLEAVGVHPEIAYLIGFAMPIFQSTLIAGTVEVSLAPMRAYRNVRSSVDITIGLAPGVDWAIKNGGHEIVLLRQNLPHAVMGSLPDRTVDVVFHHRLLGDRPPIIKRVDTKYGYTRIHLRKPGAKLKVAA